MTNLVDHIRGSVHPLKLMLKAVFAIQVAHSAKVIFIALHTLPADTSDSLLCTSITYHIMMLDTWRRIKNCFIGVCTIYLSYHFPYLGPRVIATVDWKYAFHAHVLCFESRAVRFFFFALRILQYLEQKLQEKASSSFFRPPPLST